MLLDSAEAFGDQVARHHNELLVHCYRMLGTIDDAEDAVQEALTRAWQGRQTFRRTISFRAWLYRIATNVCLNASAPRKRDGVEARHVVGPSPDHLLTGIAAADAGPEARYDAHESISLSFLTVLQLFPPRQRAVLLLRDVLAFRAAEVAALLDISVAAVSSAQQRARATLHRNYRSAGESPASGTAGRSWTSWSSPFSRSRRCACTRLMPTAGRPSPPTCRNAPAIGYRCSPYSCLRTTVTRSRTSTPSQILGCSSVSTSPGS